MSYVPVNIRQAPSLCQAPCLVPVGLGLPQGGRNTEPTSSTVDHGTDPESPLTGERVSATG